MKQCTCKVEGWKSFSFFQLWQHCTGAHTREDYSLSSSNEPPCPQGLFPCATCVMWKRIGEVQVTAEDSRRALYPNNSIKSNSCRMTGWNCSSIATGLLMQGLIYWEPFEDDGLVAKPYKLYFALEGDSEIIRQPADFSWVVHIFLHLISCPGSGSPDAWGRCYISGVFGGGSFIGLTLMGHFSTAFLAGSVTARDAGLFRTSRFPAWLVCSSALSEVIGWFLFWFVSGLFCWCLFVFPFSSFSSPPKAGHDLNSVLKVYADTI